MAGLYNWIVLLPTLTKILSSISWMTSALNDGLTEKPRFSRFLVVLGSTTTISTVRVTPPPKLGFILFHIGANRTKHTRVKRMRKRARQFAGILLSYFRYALYRASIPQLVEAQIFP